MLVIHGIYEWAVRRVAFRNDFCRGCGQATLAVRVRAFRVLHLYWVPVLPLGFWRTWHCSRCGRAPDANTRTRRGFKIAGAAMLAALAIAAWWEPPGDVHGGGLVFVWSLKIGLPLAAALALRAALRHRPDADRQKALAGIQPFTGSDCPLCSGQLLGVPDRHCLACGCRHEPLAAGGS